MDETAMQVLETNVQAFNQYSNQVLRDSEIDLTFTSVHIAIDESYDESSSPSTYNSLMDLTNTGDGLMENAHALRDEYGADLIVGIIYYPWGSAGIAWVPATQPYRRLGVSISGGSYPFVSVLCIVLDINFIFNFSGTDFVYILNYIFVSI